MAVLPKWLHYCYPANVQQQKRQAGRSSWIGQRVVRFRRLASWRIFVSLHVATVAVGFVSSSQLCTMYASARPILSSKMTVIQSHFVSGRAYHASYMN